MTTTGSFGIFTTGGGTEITTYDDINNGTYFVMPHAGSVTDMNVYIGHLYGTRMTCAIYDYNPAGGGALKGVTYEHSTIEENAWQQFNFATPVGLPAGSYILCFNFDTDTCEVGGNRFTGHNSAVMSDTYPPSITTWNGAFTEEYEICINATYEYEATASYTKVVSDSVTVTDSLIVNRSIKTMDLNILDSVMISDSFIKVGPPQTYSVNVSDSLLASDSFFLNYLVSTYSVNIGDSLSLLDSFNKRFQKRETKHITYCKFRLITT